MYKLDIYSANFDTKLTTLFYGQDIYDFRYTTEINKPGGAAFTINVLNSKATTNNLKPFNRIIIERDGVGVFIGYIEHIRATVDTVEVTCVGMLGFFNKRLISHSYADTVQSAFYDILDTVNNLYDTGISQGTTDITQNLNNIIFSSSTVLSAWVKLANLANGEVEINTDRKINFKHKLGTDKSATIQLKYKVTQIADSNLRDFNVEVQGKDMTNRLIAIRNGGTAVVESDTASIDTFGMLEKKISFLNTYSTTDLTSEAQNYITNHKVEFYAPKMTVNETKIDIATLNLGDTVAVKLDNGFMALELNERIIRREVRVSDNLTEELVLGLMPETTNLLPSSFIQDIIALANRVALIESEI